MEDHEKAARRQARLATEAIISFDTHTLDGKEPTSSYDSPTSAEAIYLSKLAARLFVSVEANDLSLYGW